MRKSILCLATLLLFGSLAVIGCTDEKNSAINPNRPGATLIVSGIVVDENGTPLQGATVSLPGIADTISSANGTFVFGRVPASINRVVVNAHKSGFFNGSAATTPSGGEVGSLRVSLISAATIQSVSAAAGGEATIDNGTGVNLPANAIMNADGSQYSGSVNVALAYLDPTAENFSELMPGGDMQAATAQNSATTLVSYGVIKVQLSDDGGKPLQLKAGQQSTITVEIPATLDGNAPDTIPLWHYDTTSGLWKEEGFAVKTGDKYIGKVGHFSDWNCDVPEGTATVRGLVVDCNQNPIAGVRVQIGQVSAYTDGDGRYERRVPANTPFTVQPMPGKGYGVSSGPIAVAPLTQGTQHTVATLTVECPCYISGSVKCGSTVAMAQVVVSWNGGYATQYTNERGEFKIAVLPGASVQLNITGFPQGYKNQTVQAPANRGETRDMGTILICDAPVPTTGANEFTLNGGPFNNRRFTFNTKYTQQFFSGDSIGAIGFQDPQDSALTVFMAHDSLWLMLTFTATKVGAASEVYISTTGTVPGDTTTFWYVGDGVASLSRFSGVGGIIEGTFSGDLQGFLGLLGGSATPEATIRNGKFSVQVLVLDEGALPMAKKQRQGIAALKKRRR